jgi:O-antigen/teichoic acid export membrane protein
MKKNFRKEPSGPKEGRARRITLNTFFMFTSEILARLVTLVTVFYMTHHWVPAAYGQYCIALNWVTIFSAVSSLGLGSLAVRDVSHDKGLTSFYLRNMIILRGGLSILFVLAMPFIGISLGYEPILRLALVVLGLRLLMDVPSLSFVTLFQAYELMALQGFVNLGGSVLRMIGTILVLHFDLGLLAVCWVWLGVTALTTLFYWWVGWKRGWKADWGSLKWKEALKMLKESVPFAAFGTFQMLYYRVDSVILKSFGGNEAVALYDVAGRLLFVVYMLADHFSIATLPSLSAHKDLSEDRGRMATRALKALTFLGLPLTVGGFFLSKPLMVLLFGFQYAAAGPAFAVLALSLIFYFAMRPCLNLMAVFSPPQLTYVFLAVFLVNVVMNFALVPIWGLMGASVASTICEILLAVLCGWLTRGYFRAPDRLFLKGMTACLGASVLMGIGIFLDPRLYWLALGPLVYGMGLFLLGGLDPDDMRSLRSIFRR